MAAETNTIMQADLARVRVADFNLQFTGNLQKLTEALGVLKVTGTLQSGTFADG